LCLCVCVPVAAGREGSRSRALAIRASAGVKGRERADDGDGVGPSTLPASGPTLPNACLLAWPCRHFFRSLQVKGGRGMDRRPTRAKRADDGQHLLPFSSRSLRWLALSSLLALAACRSPAVHTAAGEGMRPTAAGPAQHAASRAGPQKFDAGPSSFGGACERVLQESSNHG
jgi:hypothetical protein